MKKIILFLLGIFIVLNSCEPIRFSTTAIATAYVAVEISPTESIQGSNVNFYGNVYSVENTQLTSPVPGAQIRIVGSDTPGGSTFTDENGNFEITLPIVPQQNGEVISFAIEIQKEGAATYPLSQLCKDSAAWILLGISDPQEYKVASATYNNFGWDIVGKKVKCSFPISMKR